MALHSVIVSALSPVTAEHSPQRGIPPLAKVRVRGRYMKLERTVTVPELALIASTRGMLGLGIGLLVADKLNREKRQAIGKTLLLVGALSTIPLAFEIFGQGRRGGGI
jgi:hypothetical protein